MHPKTKCVNILNSALILQTVLTYKKCLSLKEKCCSAQTEIFNRQSDGECISLCLSVVTHARYFKHVLMTVICLSWISFQYHFRYICLLYVQKKNCFIICGKRWFCSKDSIKNILPLYNNLFNLLLKVEFPLNPWDVLEMFCDPARSDFLRGSSTLNHCPSGHSTSRGIPRT